MGRPKSKREDGCMYKIVNTKGGRGAGQVSEPGGLWKPGRELSLTPKGNGWSLKGFGRMVAWSNLSLSKRTRVIV